MTGLWNSALPDDPASNEWKDMWAPYLRWRRGTSVGRTIYAQLGRNPSKRDVLLMTADTPKLAELLVRAANSARDARIASYTATLGPIDHQRFSRGLDSIAAHASDCCGGTGMADHAAVRCPNPKCPVIRS